MSIKLNGATNGSIELDVPDAIGSDVTGVLLPTAAGTLDRLERAGNILQVVQGSTSTQVEIASTTYTDTGLTATITPTSGTSKILVIVNQQARLSRLTANFFAGHRIERNNVTILDSVTDNTGAFEFGMSLPSLASIGHWFIFSKMILDSPNSTNSLTYKTQARMYQTSSSGSFQFQTSSTTNGSSRIILMEVAG